MRHDESTAERVVEILRHRMTNPPTVADIASCVREVQESSKPPYRQLEPSGIPMPDEVRQRLRELGFLPKGEQ